MMPSNVKAFWWISFALATYFIVASIWAQLYPTAQYIAAFAKLSPEGQQEVRGETLIFIWLVPISLQCVTLALAWIAAFRHQNWARWVFAIVVVTPRIVGLVVGVYLSRTAQTSYDSLALLTNARSLITDALIVTAIVLVFTGNARGWFKAPVALRA